MAYLFASLPTVPDAPALATWTGQRDFCRKLEFTNAVTPVGRVPIICSDGQLFSGMTDKTFVSVSVFHDAQIPVNFEIL